MHKQISPVKTDTILLRDIAKIIKALLTYTEIEYYLNADNMVVPDAQSFNVFAASLAPDRNLHRKQCAYIANVKYNFLKPRVQKQQ